MVFQSGPDLLYKSTLLFALIVLLFTSWHAPISGDEYVHVKQAEKNIRYLKSFGKDKTALDTPISRLKHYGQSFDTITFFIADIFAIDNLYRFRHVSNACIAWLTILFASMISFKITKSKIASFLSVLLFLVSLRFMGHAMNNLKDIPFAFAFVFSIYFILRFLEHLPKISWSNLVMFSFGLSFGISIRIGGLLIFAYFVLFSGLFLYYLTVSGSMQQSITLKLVGKLVLVSLLVFLLSYLGAVLLWPFALENPIKNPWISMELIHQYPTTVRQVFEGKLYWSDQFPWYYLIKYILITVPIIVLAGFGWSMIYIWRLTDGKSIISYIFVLIAFGFPIFYAIVSGANVYGGWRQMLFVFPPLVVLSSVGLSQLIERLKSNLFLKIFGILLMVLLVYGPAKYFVLNYPYQYTFFNELIGGTNNAFGHYEIDYYFTSFKRAYEFIDGEVEGNPKIVAANFIIPEYYLNKPYQPKLIDYYDRSSAAWDYAVVCNTFLEPYQLQNDLWPPANAVYLERVDGVPIVAVLKRATSDDFAGKVAMDEESYDIAIAKLNLALEQDPQNESTRLNLARAYFLNNDFAYALAAIKYLESIYPSNEWAKDLRGEIALKKGNIEEAISLFKENILSNNRFFHSYLNLAKTLNSQGQEEEAISFLKACLRINPFYKPAYNLYGQILIERGDLELGKKMLEYSMEENSNYRRK